MPGIRLKIARSLSDIRRPDDWKWNRWLKVPSNSKEDFTLEQVKSTGRDADKIRLNAPGLDVFYFGFLVPELFLPEQFNTWLTRKSTKNKTSLISQQKSFRIFISKIQVEVSRNYVPHDRHAELIFQYQPEGSVTPVIDQLTGREPALSVTEEITFALDPDYAGLSRNIIRKVIAPLNAVIEIQYTAAGIGENLIRQTVVESISVLAERHFFTAASASQNLLATGETIGSIEYLFNIPVILSENLASFVPETINIDLLKADEFRPENTFAIPLDVSSVILPENYFTVYDSSFIHYFGQKKILIEPVKRYKVKINALKKPEEKSLGQCLDQKEERNIPFQQLNADYINYDFTSVMSGKAIEELEVKDNPVLAPRETELKVSKDVFDGLYAYQKDSINFLLGNNRTLLKPDPLLDYKPQVVHALSLMLRQGKVRNTLIIRKNHAAVSSSPLREDDWISILKTWAPEIAYEKNAAGTSVKMKSINFADYEDALKLKLKKYDCIVIDKYSPDHKLVLDHVLHSECQRIWLTAGLNENIELPDFSELRLTRAMVQEELPSRKYEYRWIPLDKKQTLEYKSQLVQGQMKIYASIERGDIYIIKPHLFTLLHQLLQTCNFASDENTSGKSAMLIPDIKASPGKVVVLSQYEKYGIEKIEKLLRADAVPFVTYKAGSPENEKSLADFRNKENVKVLIADVKAVNSVLNPGTISTIIHFDHWWNPVSQWQIEDRLAGANQVNVIQYCTSGTIEEDIYIKLADRVLTEKLIFETLSPTVYSDIIKDEEWLELYEISTESEVPKPVPPADMRKKLKSIQVDEMVTMIQRIIQKLGYTKQKVMQHLSNNDLVFVFSRLLGKREDFIFIYLNRNEEIDQNSVKHFYEEYFKVKNVQKALLITTAPVPPSCAGFFNYMPHRVSYLDSDKFGRLLHLFNLI